MAFDIELKVPDDQLQHRESASGDDVDKVRDATEMALAPQPELVIDGPMQYAAVVVSGYVRKVLTFSVHDSFQR